MDEKRPRMEEDTEISSADDEDYSLEDEFQPDDED